MRQNLPIISVQVVFFLLFLSLPAINFWFCRLPALDFGIANQALFAYADGKSANCTFILQRESMPYLALHFSLWVPILSPLKWIFGKWALLIAQAFFLVFAGEGLMRVATTYNLSKGQQFWILIHMYSIGFIYSAIADGFHDNLIAACFVPWLFLSIKNNRIGLFIACILAMLISKENMAIWLLALLPGLFALANQLKNWKWLVAGMVFCLIYLLTITQFVMPAMNPMGRFEQLDRFSHLGKSFSEIIVYCFLHPLEMLKMLFFSHVQPDEMENIKWEFWLVFLLSGAWISLRFPFFFLAYMPLILQKVWNKEVVFWGINYHYQIEFVPLISLGLIVFVSSLPKPSSKHLVLGILVLCSLASTLYHWQSRKSVWYDSTKENLLDKSHYQGRVSFSDLSPVLLHINPNYPISTNSGLLPHLVLCDKIFLFPVLPEQGYLILRNDSKDAYPLSEDDYGKEMQLLKSGQGRYKGFKRIWSSDKISLYKK